MDSVSGWTAALAAAVAAAALVPALSALWRWGRRRARTVRLVDQMPGPLALPVVGSIVSFIGIKREDLFNAFTTTTNKYAPIMRTWKGTIPDIHLCRAEDVELILSSTTHIEKSSLYSFIRSWLGDGLLTSAGKKWHTRRKMITPTFHFKILESFLDVFVEKSQIMVDMIEKELKNPKGFDVYPYITLCALDIICETAMGTQINAQRDTDSAYVKAIYAVSEAIIQRSLRPWLYSDFIFFRTQRGKTFSQDLATLHGFTKKVIQERKSVYKAKKPDNNEKDDDIGAKRRLAFLDLLLEASEGGATLSDEDIREEVDTFMFEGHDTTSAGICWVLFLLGTHLDVQEKVAEELQAIFQGSDRPPSMQDLAEMKYLERVIKETLRLYPSVPIIGRHVHEDIKVGKYTIPAGSDVSLRIYHVHRNPDYFPNPEKFDPDNFLPERVKGRHPYAYIPFSAGSRNCIGQKFALLEEKAVVSTLLRRYSFRALDKAEDLKLVSELILRPIQGVRVAVQLRKS
ncbi:hypothetical protein R5R35_010514 [Gryllus longicercus]|uniref:Cytochrome P450 n=1 Tax=Gryllus longicercus TaxID=2509291 RepID=A0AAN9VUC7_9ORTH